MTYMNYKARMEKVIDDNEEDDAKHRMKKEKEYMKYRFRDKTQFNKKIAYKNTFSINSKNPDSHRILFFYEKIVKLIENWYEIKANNVVVRAVRQELEDITEINRTIVNRFDCYIDLGLTI